MKLKLLNLKKIDIKKNKIIDFNNPDLVYFIESGYIDIFFTRYHEGREVGRRKFLFTLENEEIFFGNSFNKSDISIIGIPHPDTSIFYMRKENFFSLSDKSEISILAGKWIEKCVNYINDSSDSNNLIKIEEESKSMTLLKESSYCSENIKWIKIIKGDVSFCGVKEIYNAEKKILLPVWKNIYITAKTEECEINIMDSSEITMQTEFKNCIDFINKTFYIKTVVQFQNYILEEKQKTDFLSKNLKKVINKSYKLLFSSAQTEERYLNYFDDNESYIYISCKIIADYYKIPIKNDAKSKKMKLKENVCESIEHLLSARARKVILKNDWWKNDRGVLIAFEKDKNNPLVLIPSQNLSYTVFDISQKSVSEISVENIKNIEPAAYNIYKPLPDKKISTLMIFQYIYSSIKKGDITNIFLFSFMAGVIALVFPIITGVLVDEIIPFSNIAQTYIMFYIFILTTLTLFIIKSARAIAIVRIDSTIQYYLQSAVWDRILKLPVSFFKEYSSGELSERANGIMEISSKISQFIISSFLSLFFALFYLVLIFHYDFKFALYSSFFLFIMAVIVLSFSYIKYLNQQMVTEMDGKCSSLMFQIINGIEKIRMYASEGHLFLLWADIFSKKKYYYRKVSVIANIQGAILVSIPVFINLFMFWFFVNFKFKEMTTGIFFAFGAALTGFTVSVIEASSSVENFIEALPLYKRVQPILNEEVENRGEKEEIGVIAGNITVKNISFRYIQEQPLILNSVNFKINAGENVAIVGASGSGKSTLLRLFLGFETPVSGEIYIDNKNIKNIDIKEYRRQIGVVLQDSRLLSGDIYTNIRGNLDISAEEIENILIKTDLYDEIMELPMGLNTIIDENAKTISEGQKQRLLIARAIAGAPAILFLDEATSSLDNKSQSKIMEMFTSLNITRVSIAHRLSTVKSADKIVVLKDGFINDIGTFNELMEKKGYFYEMTTAHSDN